MIPTSTARPSLHKHTSGGTSYATDNEGGSEGQPSTSIDSLFRWDDLIADTWTEPSNPEVAEPLPSHDLNATTAKEESVISQLDDQDVIESGLAISRTGGARTGGDDGRGPSSTDAKPSSGASSHAFGVSTSKHADATTKAGKQHTIATASEKTEVDQSGTGSSKRRRASRERRDTLTNTPWTGEQAEDCLSQSAVRQGHTAIRPVRDEREDAGTARGGAISSCKTPEGLRRVSAYFSSILHERCVSSKSACRIVGRRASGVTLTNRKRDAWFDRLADVASPLIEEGRTIPHGIHGRVLLQKCLEKHVPVARATWLVKTVGADELRAFRRKGVMDDTARQYELDWIRHWTSEVHDFIDEHIEKPRQLGRKLELIYITDLTERLFDHGLLHKADHVDWLLTHVEHATHVVLPIYLLLARQALLTENAACASRLASACLWQLRAPWRVQTKNRAVALPKALEELVIALASLHSNGFLLPHHWREVRATVACLRHAGVAGPASTNLQAIITRNDRLAQWVTGTILDKDFSITVVTKALDAGLRSTDFESLASTVRDAVPDPIALISCVVTLAASTYRSESQHIYLACRLIRHWQQQQQFLDARSTMSSVLVGLRKQSLVSAHAVARIWIELFRSGHLDRVQYLQKIAAEAGLKIQDKIDVEIIASMPTQGLPTNASNWRRNALMAVRPGSHDPRSQGELKQAIAMQTKAVKMGSTSGRLTPELEGQLARLATAEMFDLSKWLHGSLLPFLERKGDGTETPFSCRFTRFVVALLEAIDDYHQLHDILSALSRRSDPDGLICIACSVETQDEVFAALGCLDKIWQTLLGTYRTLRNASYGPHRDLCLFFLRTSNWHLDAREDEQYLKDEISMCETGVAACTPLSDMELDSVEEGMSELDRILSNGPQLDTPQLSTALEKILTHIALTKQPSAPQVETVRGNLIALKNANEEMFTHILTQCLYRQLSTSDDLAIGRILSTLLSSKCIDLAALLACAQYNEVDNTTVPSRFHEPIASLRCLRFFLSTPAPSDAASLEDLDHQLEPCDRWHKKLWAQQLERDHANSLFRLMLNCNQLDPSSLLAADFESLVATPNSQAVLRRLILHRTDDSFVLLDEYLRTAPSDSIIYLRCMVLSLLHQTSELRVAPVAGSDMGDQSSWSVQARIDMTDRLLKEVDPCALPLSQVVFRLVTTPDQQTSTKDFVDAFWQTLTRAAVEGSNLQTELISKCDARLGCSLRSRAKRTLLYPPEVDKDLDTKFSQEWPVRPMVLATIISALRATLPQDGDSNLHQLILQHLDDISRGVNQSLSDNPVFIDWVQALLCNSLVYEVIFQDEADIVQLMHSLFRILSSETFQQHSVIIDQAYDAACFFALRVNEQAIQRLRLHLGPLAEDVRIKTILGDPPNAQLDEPTRAFFSNFPAALSTTKRWEQLLHPLPADTKINYDLLNVSTT